MQAALAEAKKAQALGEVPIGCVIVHQGQIIGRGHNLRETTQQAEKHAEMIAIAQANQVLDSWRLPEAELYVTLEPCLKNSSQTSFALLSATEKGRTEAAKSAAFIKIFIIVNFPSFESFQLLSLSINFIAFSKISKCFAMSVAKINSMKTGHILFIFASVKLEKMFDSFLVKIEIATLQ